MTEEEKLIEGENMAAAVVACVITFLPPAVIAALYFLLHKTPNIKHGIAIFLIFAAIFGFSILMTFIAIGGGGPGYGGTKGCGRRR